ncbi:MAG: hypothetical protein GKS07_10535 [Nitrosopumilus sp.]|nr:MAG: hypothetical protein GKS07_10535 [Nitrosopumilus sp.]
MKQELSEIKKPVTLGNQEQSCKTCPYCGQNNIALNMGLCMCGKNVDKIQYVNDSKKQIKRWYSYIGNRKSKN